jgi:hypothetical protein
MVTSSRRTDMHRECTGLSKSTFPLHTAMKQSVLMEYYMEDVRSDFDKFIPNKCTEENVKHLGLPEGGDYSVLFNKLNTFKVGLNTKLSTLDSTFVFERQQMHVCQLEGPEFLKLW